MKIPANISLKLEKTASMKAGQGIIYHKDVPDIVKYCMANNIPFTDSEMLHYGISMTKKNHRMYTNCLKHCFKSTVEDDYQQTLKALSKNDLVPTQKTL